MKTREDKVLNEDENYGIHESNQSPSTPPDNFDIDQFISLMLDNDELDNITRQSPSEVEIVSHHQVQQEESEASTYFINQSLASPDLNSAYFSQHVPLEDEHPGLVKDDNGLRAAQAAASEHPPSAIESNEASRKRKRSVSKEDDAKKDKKNSRKKRHSSKKKSRKKNKHKEHSKKKTKKKNAGKTPEKQTSSSKRKHKTRSTHEKESFNTKKKRTFPRKKPRLSITQENNPPLAEVLLPPEQDCLATVGTLNEPQQLSPLSENSSAKVRETVEPSRKRRRSKEKNTPRKKVTKSKSAAKPTSGRAAPGSKKFPLDYSYNNNSKYGIVLVPVSNHYTGEKIQSIVWSRFNYKSFEFLKKHIGIATNLEGAIFFIKKPFTDGSSLEDWLIKVGFDPARKTEQPEQKFIDGLKLVSTKEKFTPTHYISYSLDLKNQIVTFMSTMLNDQEMQKVINRKVKTLKKQAGFTKALKVYFNDEKKLCGYFNTRHPLAMGKSLLDCLRALEIKLEGEDYILEHNVSDNHENPTSSQDNKPRVLLPFDYSCNDDPTCPFAIVHVPTNLTQKQAEERIEGRFRNAGLKYLRSYLGLASGDNEIILFVKKQLEDMTLEQCMQKFGFDPDKKVEHSKEKYQQVLAVLLKKRNFLSTFHIKFQYLPQYQVVAFRSDILSIKKIKKVIMKKMKSIKADFYYIKSFILYIDDKKLYGKISDLNPLPENKTLGDCLNALDIRPFDEEAACILINNNQSTEVKNEEAELEDSSEKEIVTNSKLLYAYSYYEDKNNPIALVHLDNSLSKNEIYNISTQIRRRITRHPQLKSLTSCISLAIDEANIILYLHRPLPDGITLEFIMDKIGFDVNFKKNQPEETFKKCLKTLLAKSTAKGSKGKGLPTFYIKYHIISQREFILTSDVFDEDDMQFIINRKIALLKRKSIHIKPFEFYTNEKGQLIGKVVGKKSFSDGRTLSDYLEALDLRNQEEPGCEHKSVLDETSTENDNARDEVEVTIETDDEPEDKIETLTTTPIIPSTDASTLLRRHYKHNGLYGGTAPTVTSQSACEHLQESPESNTRSPRQGGQL